ncbi:hypothetical protein ES703_33099 [subsurface metagenome]
MKKRIKKNKEKLYKQGRGYLKTCGSLVGKDTKQPIPFNSRLKKEYKDLPDIKEAISKMTAITGNYLFQLWQGNKNQEGWLIIKNLNAITGVLGITAQRLKQYLVCLGGYVYPAFYLEKIGKKKNRLSITQEKLCSIKFNFNLTDDEIERISDPKIGTRYLYFIKNKHVTSIEFKPTDTTIKQLKNEGLGNVLVSDSFVALCLGLSDMAYKLLCYTGSNKPKGNKISFSKLVKKIHLNLERQLKQQGKPRILESIKKGFEELNNKRHIKHWNYDDQKDEFTWEYTNRIIKHPDFKREENSET